MEWVLIRYVGDTQSFVEIVLAEIPLACLKRFRDAFKDGKKLKVAFGLPNYDRQKRRKNFFLVALGFKLGASHVPGKGSITEPHPQPLIGRKEKEKMTCLQTLGISSKWGRMTQKEEQRSQKAGVRNHGQSFSGNSSDDLSQEHSSMCPVVSWDFYKPEMPMGLLFWTRGSTVTIWCL